MTNEDLLEQIQDDERAEQLHRMRALLQLESSGLEIANVNPLQTFEDGI